MTTNFLELATTLKYLGAKWLLEKKLILRPVPIKKERRTTKWWHVANFKITLSRGEVELFNKIMMDNSFPHWNQALGIATKLKPANDFLQIQ